MKYAKICKVCNQEFTTNSSGRVVCHICQPYSFSFKQEKIDYIEPEINWEEKEEGPTVKELLEEKVEVEDEESAE